MATDETSVLTTGQAARLCSVTPDTILKWIKRGRLEGVRTAGGHYRIERRDLERLVPSARFEESPSQPFQECSLQRSHCWEYLSDSGVVRDECRQCVVYRVGAARCFLMEGLEPDIGHARRFCESSCEDCVFYRRAKGLATKVLCITSDEDLITELTRKEHKGVTVRVAHNGYEASAIIQDFRPAFIAVDTKWTRAGDTELLDSMADDPRVPGLRVILVVPSGAKRRKCHPPRSDLIAGVLEKPFGVDRLAEAIDSVPADALVSVAGTPPGTARSGRP